MIYVTQLKKLCQNRLAIVLTAVFFFWLKTIIAYYADFSLGVEGTRTEGEARAGYQCMYAITTVILCGLISNKEEV